MGLEHVELNYKETIILILIDKYYKINNNSTIFEIGTINF